MSPRVVVGLLLIALATLTNGQMRRAFYGQGGQLDNECYERPYGTTCVGPIPRYFYNMNTHRCERIDNVCGYGGFFSMERCDNQCTCRLPPDGGTNLCAGAVQSQRFFYNQNGDMCIPFTYNGCEGNGNNFVTPFECDTRCDAPREIEQSEVMRRMGYNNEQAFEMQAGLYNYAPPPRPPPRPAKTIHPPALPKPHAPHARGAPPAPPSGYPPPPGGYHRGYHNAPWTHYRPPAHRPPTYRPRWPPRPPPAPFQPQRSQYIHMGHQRFPPSPQPLRQPAGQINMAHPTRNRIVGNNNNRIRIRPTQIPSSIGPMFGMNNINDKLKRPNNHPNTGGDMMRGHGMNNRNMNHGRGNFFNSYGIHVTARPSPVPSIPPSTTRPQPNNNRGAGHNNRGKQQGNIGNNNKNNNRGSSVPTDRAFGSGSLNQPAVKVVKTQATSTTQAGTGLNNARSADYYYYDMGYNPQGTTASYYTNTYGNWGGRVGNSAGVGKNVGK